MDIEFKILDVQSKYRILKDYKLTVNEVKAN